MPSPPSPPTPARAALPRAAAPLLPLLWLCASGCATTRATPPPTAHQGIEVIALRRSAAGYMLDLRYRVVDVDKAAPLLSRRERPYLLHPRTGARFQVPAPPKVGALRQLPRHPETNRTYFVLFANPGRTLGPGDRVTVVLGEVHLPDVPVE